MGSLATIKGKVVPLRNVVLVSHLESGQRITSGGIVLLDDVNLGSNGTNGIRARWGKVHAIGPEVLDIKVGDWILIKHGRWTYGMEVEAEDGTVIKLHRVEYPDSVTLVSEGEDFPLEIKPMN